MNRTSLDVLAFAALAAALAACGGGDNGPAATTPATNDPLEVPMGVGQSNTALVSWLASLPAQAADTREPVSVESFSPKLSDDDEPLPVGS